MSKDEELTLELGGAFEEEEIAGPQEGDADYYLDEEDPDEVESTEPKKKKAAVIRRGFVFTGKYAAFWTIYWLAALVFLTATSKIVVGGMKAELATGRAVLIALYAGIAGSILLGTLVLHPGRRMTAGGKKDRVQIMPWDFLWMLPVDIWCFFIIEYLNNPDFSEMKFGYMLMNVAFILGIHLVVFFWLNSLKWSLLVILLGWSSLAIAFYFVYLFRGEPLQLIDFFSVATAATVAGNYKYQLTRAIVVDVIVAMCGSALILQMTDRVLVRKSRFGKLLMRVCVCCFMVLMYPVYVDVNWNGGAGILTDLFAPIKTYHEYGTTVGFFCVAKYMRLTPPDGYSVSETKQIAEHSKETNEEEKQAHNAAGKVEPVNIICIMNESWADYRYVGNLQTNIPVMPYFDSMKENTIKGHTMVCIRGGGTAKTEYEFLTGNSVKRFPGMVPYVSYFTHDQYSLVTTLQAQGYEAVAMHPYKGSNWKRTSAYKLLNFEKFYTQDDFDEDTQTYHGHISDQANYEKIIDLVNKKKNKDDPMFVFDITMQNHGGYTVNDVPQLVTVDGYENNVVNNFLSLEKLSDDALKYLIEYFKNYSEPTMIVMFGDHYPTMPDRFTEYISGSKYEDLNIEQQQHYYMTPFFIWANYDIPEQDDVVTSTNYLGTLMLDQTGLEMADYNYYLKDMMNTIPALNHMGYVDENGEYHTWKKGDTKHLEKEWDYECLQYNNLAEKFNRQDWFFTLPDKKIKE
uniref:LTA synthase family protein n=1 Tax=Eubacterium cellulosolvens TaxID=29322 RepID=UPI00047FE674|nr:LTA synthase family protein [[Eubacterium] cellulosolvens]